MGVTLKPESAYGLIEFPGKKGRGASTPSRIICAQDAFFVNSRANDALQCNGRPLAEIASVPNSPRPSTWPWWAWVIHRLESGPSAGSLRDQQPNCQAKSLLASNRWVVWSAPTSPRDTGWRTRDGSSYAGAQQGLKHPGWGRPPSWAIPSKVTLTARSDRDMDLPRGDRA